MRTAKKGQRKSDPTQPIGISFHLPAMTQKRTTRLPRLFASIACPKRERMGTTRGGSTDSKSDPYQCVRSRITDFGQVVFEPEQVPSALQSACDLVFEFRNESAKSWLRRESAPGERFSTVSAVGRSTGRPRNPQERRLSARTRLRRRAILASQLVTQRGIEPAIRTS